MINTSTKYKQFVYNKSPYELDARHFLPYALVKVIDTRARQLARYTVSSISPQSNIAQLTDENLKGEFRYGTLEDFYFLLNGTKLLMPDEDDHSEQVGWMSEVMSDKDGNFPVYSDESGNFTEPLVIAVAYDEQVTTVGRTFYFDQNIDSVPKDFDLIYYRTGTEIEREEVRNNDLYTFVSMKPVTRYDTIMVTIHSTTKPYRRVHLIEDIPGIYAVYSDTDIISINMVQTVDIFSEELTVSEIEIAVENATKLLNILNTSGLERYLQRRQPVECKLIMVFPDNTEEEILLGYWELAEWKSNKGALEATFIIRDPIDKLTQDEYIKGMLPETSTSLYELAKDVLDDAGITDYTIDIELLNIYSSACLPIASHKELLRMIAQAGQSVVLPTPEGGIHIKYVSPLIVGNNKIEDGAFNKEATETPWTLQNVSFSEEYIYSGNASVTFTDAGSISQTVQSVTGRKYYARFYAMPTQSLENEAGETGLYINEVLKSADLRVANLTPYEWTPVSILFEGDADSLAVAFKNGLTAGVLFIDAFMLLDLTLLYGAGNEPDQEWCDSYIRFFTTQMLIPRANDPEPVDNLDYSILLDAPEISLADPVKAVETNIYNYAAETESSEIYKGTRVISGTETFDIKFNSIAKDCEITAQAVDDAGNVLTDVTVTILEKHIYSKAATLKIRANCSVQITVTGKKVNTTTSSYRVTADIELSLVADAVAKTIDNMLITNRIVAEDVTSFAAYWYARRYRYDFDWRQNPAIELLDTVTVHDDFSNNNGVLLTDRELDYNNGILTGNSKGVF